MPVSPISAAHLDKTRAKRHALVFTKLRVLELPYARVLLLDLDLLPRAAGEGEGLDQLLRVPAPAAKYCCAEEPPGLRHGEVMPVDNRGDCWWSPNAGVMRLDPLPSLPDRLAQVHLEERLQYEKKLI